MVSTSEPGPVHPKLRQVVDEHFEGLSFSLGARGILSELLANGSRAIPLGEPAATEAQADELVSQLRTVLPAVASELRRYSDIEERVSARTLDGVLNGFCPFPPFCFGQSATIEAGADTGSGFGEQPEVMTAGGGRDVQLGADVEMEARA